MNRKNIAIIIPGGIGTGKNNIGVPVIEGVVESLAKKFQVTVFQLYKINEGYQPRGFELVSIHSSSALGRLWRCFFLVRKFHRKNKFSAVHGFWVLPNGFIAVLAGKLLGIKSLVSLQGGDAISLPEIGYGQLQKWLPRQLAFWTMKNADVFISPSMYLVAILKAMGLDRKDVHYIPLGIDAHSFTFRDREEPAHPVRFLHIGNLTAVKDQITLLNAFKIISDSIPARLTLIGEGELEVQIKQHAQTIGILDNVLFQHQVSYASLPEVYHTAEVLLHTSLSEGHPIVAEEAMSCGLLVCGTAVGLLYDLKDECVVAVDVRDHQSLARATLSLLGDPHRMKAMRLRARHWAEQHSMLWTVERFEELYNQE